MNRFLLLLMTLCVATPTLADDLPDVEALVARQSHRLRHCLTKAHESDPTTSGRIAVDWAVDDEMTRDVRLVENTTGSEVLGTCVRRRIRRWRFPGVRSAFVSHPFEFAPHPSEPTS